MRLIQDTVFFSYKWRNDHLFPSLDFEVYVRRRIFLVIKNIKVAVNASYTRHSFFLL